MQCVYAALVYERNEVGEAPPHGRRKLSSGDAERLLAVRFGKPVTLPQGAVVTSGPNTCPACGSAAVEWATTAVQLDRDRVHPVVWHETEQLADSFVCTSCDAGWYEPEPFRWVRPYWIIS